MATLGPSHVLMLEVTPDRRLSNTDPRAGHGSPKRTDALFPGRAVRAPQRAKASPRLSPQDFGPALLLARRVSSLTERGRLQLLCSFSMLHSDILLE